jgi:RND family efflux transporter MFP subunit
LYADMALQPLLHGHHRSRALPVRLGREIVHSLPRALRPRTVTGRHLALILTTAVLAVGLIPWPHNVTAGATVKTDTMAFVGAPFDGYLESSAVQPGSQVRVGDRLFAVGTRELALERASIQAEIAQASREAEKRRAVNQLSEMQVAEAQVLQAQAKLAQIQQRVKAAAVIAPMDGVVIEGEPGKNLGGAVRRGDTIVKIAALSSLYVEAAVPEKDLGHVTLGQKTRLTLLAEPALTHELTVERIIPLASVVDGENTFAVRLAIEGAAQNWWRPGMTGVAKISVGWRPLAWVATRRLIDYLRIKLWI